MFNAVKAHVPDNLQHKITEQEIYDELKATHNNCYEHFLSQPIIVKSYSRLTDPNVDKKTVSSIIFTTTI